MLVKILKFSFFVFRRKVAARGRNDAGAGNSALPIVGAVNSQLSFGRDALHPRAEDARQSASDGVQGDGQRVRARVDDGAARHRQQTQRVPRGRLGRAGRQESDAGLVQAPEEQPRRHHQGGGRSGRLQTLRRRLLQQ